MSMPEPVDLTNCDREPIQVPGSIQPFGALLACDPHAGTVLRHSLNAGEMLGIAGVVNGRTLGDLVGQEVAHRLRNALATVGDGPRPALVFAVPINGRGVFDISVHRHDGSAIIEFEAAADDGRPLELARTLITRTGASESVEQLLAVSARLLRAVIGYDRVMIYRFEQDGSGKVASESRRGDLESFLGQYFPASDIPVQARALYLRNTIRVIGNADGRTVAIEPQLDAEGRPLDLSFAHLRSVSPVHCEYLRNMGVAASMSISVIVNGALWGLIACHHYTPRTMSMAERVAAEMFGAFFSLHLQTLKQKRTLEVAASARQALDRFSMRASQRGDMREVFVESLDELSGLLPCDGAGLWMDGQWTTRGTVPPPDVIAGLIGFIASVSDNKVWATHVLAERLPDADAYGGVASGLLSIPLSHGPKNYLLFFRKELVQTLNWAGNPEKQYESGPLGDRLTPRKSFAIWKETVRLQAQPWTDADIEIAEVARATMVEVVLRQHELMEDERARSDVRQRMLNEELNHRVKNILAVIKSLIGHPVEAGRSLGDYVASLKGRIQALSFAHDQVVRGDGGGPLLDLLQAELSPYRTGAATIRLDGPKVFLDARAFSVMALVLHELATNAAKYGALSGADGRLDVRWGAVEGGECEIVWTETVGAQVRAPLRAGFGTALIDRSIPYDLGGETSVTFRPEGVLARLRLPARHLTIDQSGAEAPRAPMREKDGDVDDLRLSDLSILLVEDQILIAMDVEAMLEDRGATNLSTANTVAAALAILRAGAPDIAVLDVNLGSETSIPVATELARRGVPFVFATGYGDGGAIPPEFRDVPLVRKPYDIGDLIGAMSKALRGAPAGTER